MSRTASKNEARSSGLKSPELSRSLATTLEISVASCGLSPTNSGMAIGIGDSEPSDCRPVSCADAGHTATIASSPESSTIPERRSGNAAGQNWRSKSDVGAKVVMNSVI
jgi:hypothetical protein